MSITHIETLVYNPIFLSKVIQSFMTGYGKDVDIKTIFYVLPIVMYKDSREILNSARSNSTLYSTFSKDNDFDNYGLKLNTKFCLNQITGIFDDYIEITKQSIIVLSNQHKILFNGKVSLLEKFEFKKSPNLIREYFKAAYYLGIILNKIEVIEFEDFLEIKLEV
ncbi:three component ABC system middle component [Clostridium estertheticum]|uniref:Uncharacterized protein n=1 Tax=Clostridium estertheticum subsp. estertheticum TaxID=1552 RepID=A0A1J0GGD2_9CLOT|nr:three component ABC system middle component [Clostridium estertheticum]APC39966.1 hypothetical protein A7L45_07735 [Clostridium estertheticum subsp. estertheticum]MBZ9613960.1 DUF6521 family protein [Clostridium estertheticum subsp. laramiense]WAG73918.1 DUF6521 family protein [Clostridium estertheticum]